MKVAVASGKGGTGKTTVSANLSHYLSGKYKTVLVDLDVEEPNAGLFLPLKRDKIYIKTNYVPTWIAEKCTLCNICQDSCVYNAIVKMPDEIMIFPKLCHSCYACSELCPKDALPMIPQSIGILQSFRSDDLDFVESRLDIGQEMAVPLIAQTIDFVDENYDDREFVIYDSPPGTSCPVIETLKNADFVILVTEPTPFGLNDLKLAVETVRELDKDFAVVINRYGVGNDEVEKYCQTESIEILAKIPNKREIAEIYSSGKLIYPLNDDFKEALKKIEKFLSEKLKK